MNWWNFWKYKLKGKYETTVKEGGQEIEVEISLYRHVEHGGCATRSRVLGIVGFDTAPTQLQFPTNDQAPRRKKRRRRVTEANTTGLPNSAVAD